MSDGQTESPHWDLDHQFGWYDLVVKAADDAGFQVHVAATSRRRPSVSDPALGGLRLKR
jgi:hypothetical protein